MPVAAAAAVAAAKTGRRVCYSLNRNDDMRINGGASVTWWLGCYAWSWSTSQPSHLCQSTDGACALQFTYLLVNVMVRKAPAHI